MKVRKPQLLHYDAILFDVDGTLIDSAPGILHTLEEVFQKMGVDVTGVNLRRYLGPPLRKSFGEHFTELDKIEQATRLYRESYAVKGSHECAAYSGAAEMLQRLKDAGLILCTATSKPTEVVTPILEEKGLAPFFDFIGGASMDESRDTKTDVVHYVLSQPMLQGKRVLMVGDRNDACAARQTAVWTLPVHCTAMAAAKSLRPSTRCCWPRAAPTLPTSCWSSVPETTRNKGNGENYETEYTTGKTVADAHAEAGSAGVHCVCTGGAADHWHHPCPDPPWQGTGCLFGAAGHRAACG